jgi:hypothetical protein
MIFMTTNETAIKRSRTEAEVEQDLADVARMYVRGISTNEIARAIEHQYSAGDVAVSITSIRQDIARIRQEWVNSALLDFNERKAEELARLDQLEAAYWKAWEDSCQPKTITEDFKGVQQALSGGRAVDLEINTTKNVVEERDGNALYLQGVERCIDKRCKIIGLFSPELYQVSWRRDVEKLGWKPEEADRLKENAVKAIMDMLERAADDSRLASGNITDAEFSDNGEQE